MKHDNTTNKALHLLLAQLHGWYGAPTDEQIARLSRYAELLAGYAAANVIGTREVPKILLDHVLDSLSCLHLQDLTSAERLIDVGSGGGLPGIPLAIVQPRLNVTLLEATEKKARFLEHAREELGLGNVRVLNRRAEEAGRQTEYRDRYDVVTSRALAALPVVVEYCAPFVRPGGRILAMKGRLENDELDAGERAAIKLAAEFHGVTEVPIHPELEQKQRRIVVFRKTRPTPTGYPRRVGLAKKRPLGS